MTPLIYLYSHPIQYFAPLNKALAGSGVFDLTVCYCSKRGLEAMHDPGFRVPVQWDIPLLEGYKSVFLPNWRKGGAPEGGFWSLINPGILGLLWRAPKGYVVVHGWGYFTHLLVILAARLFGHRLCIRGESAWHQEQGQPAGKRWLKRALFQYVLFPLADYLLCIGKQNKAFYRHYGVPERKLIFTPYSVNNAHFQGQFRQFQGQKSMLRRALGLPERGRLVLFSGKFTAKKRPLDLLRAFHQADVPNTGLVFVGEGPLRREMEAYCRKNQLTNVHLTGFINQADISRYYAIADVFVMCSGPGETWGLSVNEAMNFGLPLLLSDMTGCADDLCPSPENGFVFPTGDVEALSGHLKHLLTAPEDQLKAMGQFSQEIVARYSFETILQNLSARLANTP